MASNLGLVSCYTVVSPKAPHHTPHLGLFPQNYVYLGEGKTELCLSLLQPQV